MLFKTAQHVKHEGCLLHDETLFMRCHQPAGIEPETVYSTT